jgi:hypothetical protein
MRRLVRSNRIDIKSGMERWLDPELCSFEADFQPFSSRIDLAPWSDLTRLPCG